MLKKTVSIIMVSVLLLITAVACSSRENSTENDASLSSETSPIEQGNLNTSEEQELESENILPEDGLSTIFANELRYTRHDELVSVLNEWLNQHKNGTFTEIQNHHPSYPVDFPSADHLPVVDSVEDIVIAWRDAEKLDENTETEGVVYIIVPIDDSHIYILEPVLFADEEDKTTIGFGSSSFSEMSIEDFFVHSNTTSFPIGE